MRRSSIFAFLGLVLLAGLIQPVESQTPDHKVGGFHSSNIAPGRSWNLTLQNVGTYHYHCHPHPYMEGVIEIRPDGLSGHVAVTIQGYAYEPDIVAVAPNTTITFTNKDTVVHTVDESAPPSGTTAKGSPATAFLVGVIVVAGVACIARRKND